MVAITVPSAEEERLLLLVANFAGLDQLQITVKEGASDVEFAGPGGEQAFGSNTAARYLASLSPRAAQLLGEGADQQAKVAEWLAFRHSELRPPLMDDRLAKLNEWLQNRTYLAGGTQPSLADLVLYAAVSPAAAAFPVAQHGHFCNLLRWYDHLNHTADSLGLFPAAKFAKPAYVPPPPPAPPADKQQQQQQQQGKAAPAAAAAAAEAGDKGKGKAGKGSGAAAAPAAAAAAGGPAAAAEGGKKDKKQKEKSGEPATPAASGDAGAAAAASSSSSGAAAAADGPTVDLLDIRVGQIVKVGRHPNADSLYVEEIDLGEEQPRQIVSGLVKFVPEDKMLNRRVVVVTNLKPAKMRDVMSYGMVLCASNDAHDSVDPITPPEGVPLGEKVTFEGYNAEPEAQLNPKKKQFEKIAPDLQTDAQGLCVYRGVPFMTSKGPITASIPNAHIK